jgi:hypothetical protein
MKRSEGGLRASEERLGCLKMEEIGEGTSAAPPLLTRHSSSLPPTLTVVPAFLMNCT